MSRQDMEQLIETVTQQVLASLGAAPMQNAADQGKYRLLLLAKPGTPVPEELTEDAVIFELEDYETHRNILRYDRVLVGNLSVTQLADIAQGRIGDSVSCAVIYALLSGVEVQLLERAPEHRKFAGRANPSLYGVLEGYVRTLQIFGVKLLGETKKPVLREAKPARYMAPPVTVPRGTAAPNANRLITEAEACALLKTGSPVYLPKGAIVTPSARDVFTQARAELIQER